MKSKDSNGKGDVPLGLGMALAQNPQALQAYAALSESQRDAVLQSARSVSSRQEMAVMVQRLADGEI